MSGWSKLSSRRGFLTSLAALGAAGFAGSARGFFLADKKKLKLGFDNFSIRAFDWKAPRLIEYASSLQVDTLLLSDLDVYESLEEDYLKKIRDQADRVGVELHAGTGSICPTSQSYNHTKWGKAEDHARLLIRTARQLGSPVARCYLGSRRDRDGDGGIYRHIDQMVKVLKAVKSEAEDAKVTIAVENHAGDMQAWELVELIEAAGTGFVGATMDPGNATWALEDPMVNLETLGPYAVTSGIRDTAVWETDNGADCMWANMGQGVVDWQAYVKRFQELCPRTPFVLEIISYKWSSEAQYLRPEFWSRFPRARARELARFVALAKRGKEFEIPRGRPAGAASPELERAQQKYDLEESLAYCREVLGLGLRR
ncbi:MAG: sugar phosphate isomerase/epimerase [Pirellulales bacterium]|nr:sugar phosphate isomerase/epimerase [Pirellulales bacterium]